MTRASRPCWRRSHGRDARVTNFITLCSLCSLWLLISGCARPDRPGPAGYFGPTEPMVDVIAAINANNQPLDTLRATGHFNAKFQESRDEKPTPVDGEITVLYQRPRSMRMRATNLAAGEIFDVGSNDERYWVIVKRQDRMYWGLWDQVEFVDRGQVPIPPDLLLEVLPVQTHPTNFLQEPMPAMTFQHDADAYVISWHAMLSDRLVVRKQVWYDRTTLLPINVLLFDPNGRVLLRAYLSRHKPVEVPGLPREQWPKIPTYLDLFFTDSGSRLMISLDRDLALQGGTPPAPNTRSFIFPREPSVMHVIPLDAPTTREQ